MGGNAAVCKIYRQQIKKQFANKVMNHAAIEYVMDQISPNGGSATNLEMAPLMSSLTYAAIEGKESILESILNKPKYKNYKGNGKAVYDTVKKTVSDR